MNNTPISNNTFNEEYIKNLLSFGDRFTYSIYEMASKNEENIKTIKISFHRFRLFYSVNPDRYIMEKDVVKVKEDPDIDFYSIILEFSFIGNILYKIFKKTNDYITKKKKDSEIKYNNMQEYLNLVNKDIEKTKEYAKFYVNKSLKIVNEMRDRRKNNV